MIKRNNSAQLNCERKIGIQGEDSNQDVHVSQQPVATYLFENSKSIAEADTSISQISNHFIHNCVNRSLRVPRERVEV